MEARDDFLAIASHELRTPLTPLKLQVQTLIHLAKRHASALVAGPDPAHAPPLVQQITRVALKSDVHIRQMTMLIDNLLDVSKLTSSQGLSIQTMHLDLSATVREIAAHYSEAGRSAECVVELEIEPDVFAQADPPAHGASPRQSADQRL